MPQTTGSNPLHDLLGGRRGALESALPSVVFVIVYLVSGSDLRIALVLALLTATVLAGARMMRREKPVRVLGGLAAVAVAAVVAARIGLGISRVLLGFPMVLVVIAASWWAIRRSLPEDHPGIMHPRVHRSA